MRADGSHERQLTHNTVREGFPAWQPPAAAAPPPAGGERMGRTAQGYRAAPPGLSLSALPSAARGHRRDRCPRREGDLDWSAASPTADGGAGANSWSYGASVSDDGRFVAFRSEATQPRRYASGSFETTVYVYDFKQRTVETVSRESNLGLGADGDSREEQISGNGRFVVFRTDAKNLGGPIVADENVYVYDRQTDRVELISRRSAKAGGGGRGPEFGTVPSISARRPLRLLPDAIDQPRRADHRRRLRQRLRPRPQEEADLPGLATLEGRAGRQGRLLRTLDRAPRNRGRLREPGPQPGRADQADGQRQRLRLQLEHAPDRA